MCETNRQFYIKVKIIMMIASVTLAVGLTTEMCRISAEHSSNGKRIWKSKMFVAAVDCNEMRWCAGGGGGFKRMA